MNKKQDQNTKTIFKVIFAWEDEKEEKWLEQMAAEGWQLISVAPYVYTFRRGEPEKVIYRLDYKRTIDKDYQEYLNLFRDAGWELFATFANWHYFRISPKNDETPEIYNTDRAKAQKYRRLLFGLIPLLPIFSVFLTRLNNIPYEKEGSFYDVIYLTSDILMGALLLFWVYILIKIWNKIKKLES